MCITLRLFGKNIRMSIFSKFFVLFVDKPVFPA